MKNTFLLTFTILCFGLIQAQSLSSSASYIKEKFPSEYQQTIRKYAVEDWDSDYAMIVFEISRQADALTSLVSKFQPEHTNVAFEAIKEWSKNGKQSINIELFKDINVFSVENLLQLHCDWTMVEFEYDRQVEAKTSY